MRLNHENVDELFFILSAAGIDPFCNSADELMNCLCKYVRIYFHCFFKHVIISVTLPVLPCFGLIVGLNRFVHQVGSGRVTKICSPLITT